jgi:hypothetical protein
VENASIRSSESGQAGDCDAAFALRRHTPYQATATAGDTAAAGATARHAAPKRPRADDGETEADSSSWRGADRRSLQSATKDASRSSPYRPWAYSRCEHAAGGRGVEYRNRHGHGSGGGGGRGDGDGGRRDELDRDAYGVRDGGRWSPHPGKRSAERIGPYEFICLYGASTCSAYCAVGDGQFRKRPFLDHPITTKKARQRPLASDYT